MFTSITNSGFSEASQNFWISAFIKCPLCAWYCAAGTFVKSCHGLYYDIAWTCREGFSKSLEKSKIMEGFFFFKLKLKKLQLYKIALHQLCFSMRTWKFFQADNLPNTSWQLLLDWQVFYKPRKCKMASYPCITSVFQWRHIEKPMRCNKENSRHITTMEWFWMVFNLQISGNAPHCLWIFKKFFMPCLTPLGRCFPIWFYRLRNIAAGSDLW